jgi:zinc transporter ZupT
MIDKLISSDLAALAADDRHAVPTFEALLGAPRPSVPKVARAKRAPWLLPIGPIVVVLAAAGALREVNQDFVDVPQLAVALGVALMALIGLVYADFAKPRPLASIVAAGLFIPLAGVGFVIEWHHHMTGCLFIDGNGESIGPCQAARIVTTPGFALISWSAIMVAAAVGARLIPWKGSSAWNIPAQIATLTVLLTWLGLNLYEDISMEVARFHYTHTAGVGAERWAPYHSRVLLGFPDLVKFIRAHSTERMWDALVSGAVSFALATSIGIASIWERNKPSRWLRLLEFPAIIPLGITVAAASLVLATLQQQLFELHRGDPDDIPWFAACGSIGAVVAFASMLLRRRRREALS